MDISEQIIMLAALVLAVAVVGVSTWFLFNANGRGLAWLIPGATTTPVGPIAPMPAATSRATSSGETAGFKRYADKNLKYGFQYPAALALTSFADVPGASIDQMTLRVQPLLTGQFVAADPKASLLATDLSCDAAGPTGSITCTNDKVEDFVSAAGVSGYRVLRTKKTTGAETATVHDVAYVFPLQSITTLNKINYVAVLLAVDTPTPENLAALEGIVKTYVTLK